VDRPAVNIRLTRGSHARTSVKRRGSPPKQPKSGDFGYGFRECVRPASLKSILRKGLMPILPWSFRDIEFDSLASPPITRSRYAIARSSAIR
jgi:hypothetical protein